MDRTGIIVVSLCVVLLGVWFVMENKRAAKLAEQQWQFARTNIVATQAHTNSPLAAPTTPTTTATATTALDANAPEELIVLKNNSARYTFTSRGGGLKSVELPQYPETVSARWKKESPTNGVATLNRQAPVPVLRNSRRCQPSGRRRFHVE